MSRRAQSASKRADFLDAVGVLLVCREVPPPPPPMPGQPAAIAADPADGPELFLAVWDDGSVTALHGHVDLGTGLCTALTQIVAEELDVDPARVAMVMGSTASAPNQGATIASASIQIHAAPLRTAAALARQWLVGAAAARLGTAAEALDALDGVVADRTDPSRCVDYGQLLTGRRVVLDLSTTTQATPKSPADYRVVGRSLPRVDIPAKAAGVETFVHDKRLPGLLHGRVVRPPYAGVDAGDFVGRTLESVDEASISHLPGIRAVVAIGDFVGIVAEREDVAELAMRSLRVVWKPWPGLPPLDDLAQALKANPSTRRVLVDRGDVDTALGGIAEPMARRYVWPYQLHASIGPPCAVADWQGDALTVWAGTQNPHVLRADLATLTGLPAPRIDVVRMEAAGCYGRNGADDVAADAVLLSRAVGRPVRVQLSREQEQLWEPKGAAQLMEVAGGLAADGAIAAYDFQTAYPSNGAPTLALLLTRAVEPVATAFEMGDRTAVPPYETPALRVVAHDMAPILRASWLRGVSALPNAFAHESFVDELATAAGTDPVAFRLRHLKDPRAADLVRATAERAGWQPHAGPRQQPSDGKVLKGQGFAYARYVHSKFPGFGAAWAAWVADVEVDAQTGEVHVARVVVGHDAGLMVNPAGVTHQVHGNVLQTTSRALKESLPLDPATSLPASREWGSYPILAFRDVPVVEVLLMPRPGEPPLGAGESASVPGTAAIANAIFDATGVRFREPPFTPEVVRAALRPLPPPPAAPPLPAAAPAVPPGTRWPRPRRLAVRAGALAAALVGVCLAALGVRSAIAPVAPGSTAGLYAAGTIERGRLVAAAGNCVGCHTAPGGRPNAGGRSLETPFGSVFSTNITPDPATGIGAWSFSAFERAMREGVSRDGHHLYPAFPYTAYTKTSDADLTALYAWLMAQPAVAAEPPATRLAFPFGVRPLMAFWNALALVPGPVAAVPSRSAEWNRGAYLVDGLGHCGACHTPRNALGAERTGPAYLAGAVVDGWQAPALTGLGQAAPLRWTETDFFDYLRRGHSARHGSAAGPMAPVVGELQALPDTDLRAMANYLASFNVEASGDESRAAELVARAADAGRVPGPDQRLFVGACGACHHDGDGPAVFGQNLPLAWSSKLHAERPDNLLAVILDGVQEPATRELGFMPAFRDALDDAAIARLTAYLRLRFAPGEPAWPDLVGAVARRRASASAP